MEFLTSVQQKLFNEEISREINVRECDVIVVGGGDTAMDCIRTAIREGANSVTCHYRRDSHNMPGSYKEYRNAVEEGAEFEFYSSPKSVVIDENNKVLGLNFAKTTLTQADGNKGRQQVIEIENSERFCKADVIIFALGFEPEVPKFLEENGIKTNSWGGIVTSSNGETSISGVYAGGDVTRGADLVVRATYDGREIAKNIINSFIK